MEYNAGMTSLAGTVLCLTMNPSVDVSTHTDRVVPTDKLRCGPAETRRRRWRPQRRQRGAPPRRPQQALFPAGGQRASGYGTPRDVGLPVRALPIAQDTRENFTVQALDTGAEFRFVLPGPTLTEGEWTGLPGGH